MREGMSDMKSGIIKAAALAAGLAVLAAGCAPVGAAPEFSYTVNDTGQTLFYDEYTTIDAPGEGDAYFGQDAQYAANEMRFEDNGDGTVTDLNTGLVWQQSVGEKMTWDDAMAGAADLSLGGHTDWRLPTVKELYSLVDFGGEDPTGFLGADVSQMKPFIDTEYFDFRYGNPEIGEDITGAQFATSTLYTGAQEGAQAAAFSVNFADGRVKGTGLVSLSGEARRFFVRYVRGNERYGQNDFMDNGDGTVTDKATGLMWMKQDSGHLGAEDNADGLLNWPQALAWAESLEYAGYDDWTLPDAKQMQSIVDYTRSPVSSGSAAIDALFEATPITDSKGGQNYGYYWTGTTHVSAVFGGDNAVYISFGDAQGLLTAGVEPDCACPTEDPNVPYPLVDLHGAGAQRTDPKTGDPANFPYGRYAQSEIVRIYDLARLVRVAE